MRDQTDYKKVLEEFRAHYRSLYDVNLDDEVLYFFIRVNQMQSDLGKRIEKIPKVTFRTGLDYFLYGVGKWVVPIILLMISGSVVFLFKAVENTPTNQAEIVVMEGRHPYLKITSDSATYLIPLKTNPDDKIH